MPHSFRVWCKITFTDYLAMTQCHKMMHFRIFGSIQFPKKGSKQIRGDSLTLRCGTYKCLFINCIKRKIRFLWEIIYPCTACLSKDHIKNQFCNRNLFFCHREYLLFRIYFDYTDLIQQMQIIFLRERILPVDSSAGFSFCGKLTLVT